jgi:hypothetical protein
MTTRNDQFKAFMDNGLIEAEIARAVKSGWTEISTAFDGLVSQHKTAAQAVSLPRTSLFAKKSDEVPGFTWKAWFPRSSPLLDVPPQFDKTRAKAAARLIRAALDMAKKDAAAKVVTA